MTGREWPRRRDEDDVIQQRISAVQHQERTLLSRELHDRVAHTLAASRMRFELAECTADSEKSVALRGQGLMLLEGAIKVVQSIAGELRQVVGNRTLEAALAEYLDRADLDQIVTLTSNEVAPFANAVAREEAFLIVREALRNAFAHAAAHQITVTVTVDEGGMTAAVRDDGRGFRLKGVGPKHMGLTGMRERADLIGARLNIRSRLGVGTSVELRIPHDRC